MESLDCKRDGRFTGTCFGDGIHSAVVEESSTVDRTDLAVPRLVDIQSICHCLHDFTMIVPRNAKYCAICCVTRNRNSIGDYCIVSILIISVFNTIVTERAQLSLLSPPVVITIFVTTIFLVTISVIAIVAVVAAIVHIFVGGPCGCIHWNAVVYISFFGLI